MSVRIYLDMCALKRPFDDLTQAQLLIDATAVDALLQFCRGHGGELIGSDALLFENSRNPNPIRRELTAEILTEANTTVPHSAEVEGRALELSSLGIPLMDALHPASAEVGAADWFCTTDQDLVSRVSRASLRVRVLPPADLVREVLQ